MGIPPSKLTFELTESALIDTAVPGMLARLRNYELKHTINGMVDQHNGFISEVTRVAREVGAEGKLGQARPSRSRSAASGGPHRQCQT